MINDKGYLSEDLLNGADIQQALLNNHNLMLKQVPDLNGSYRYLADNQTAIYQLENNKTYLYLNSHPTNKQIYLISGYNGTWLRIATQIADSVNFIYDATNAQLTIQALRTCRGYLFELVNIAGK